MDISKLLDRFQVDGDFSLAPDAALHPPSSHHLQVKIHKNTSFYNKNNPFIFILKNIIWSEICVTLSPAAGYFKITS